MINLRLTFLAAGVAAALLTPALAQRATPEQMGQIGRRADYSTLHMESNLGSFKIYPGEGRCEIEFSGTVLISKLKDVTDPNGEAVVKAEVVTSPGIITEFTGYDRTVYHGTGKITVTGSWRALQWFGTDMTAVWYGRGVTRITGEFDRDLKTGTYWYSDPEDRGNFSTNMMVLSLPERRLGVVRGVTPRRRGGGGN